MKAGLWPGWNVPNDVVTMFGALLGQGASAPIYPVNGADPPNFPLRANVLSKLAADIPTRSGVGIYVVTLDVNYVPVQMLDFGVDVYGTAGAWGQVSAWARATRQLTVRIFAPGGTAADLASGTDLAVITINGRNSGAS